MGQSSSQRWYHRVTPSAFEDQSRPGERGDPDFLEIDSIFSLRSQGSTEQLTRNPLIQKFLRGAASLHPIPRHRFPLWRLHTVLWALMGSPFEPLRDVSLKWLKLKPIFLVVITSARRVSELGALLCRSDLCVFHRDKVVLITDPSFRPKVATKFHTDLEIILPSFYPRPTHPRERKWHRLDVRRALKFYLACTQDIRNTDFLFLPH